MLLIHDAASVDSYFRLVRTGVDDQTHGIHSPTSSLGKFKRSGISQCQCSCSLLRWLSAFLAYGLSSVFGGSMGNVRPRTYLLLFQYASSSVWMGLFPSRIFHSSFVLFVSLKITIASRLHGYLSLLVLACASADQSIPGVFLR